MRKTLLFTLCLFAISGCKGSENELTWMHVPSDPEVKQYVFQQCLQSTKGPESTQYNDWDEAIAACSRHAESVSSYCPKGARCLENVNVKLEQVRQVLPKEFAK